MTHNFSNSQSGFLVKKQQLVETHRTQSASCPPARVRLGFASVYTHIYHAHTNRIQH